MIICDITLLNTDLIIFLKFYSISNRVTNFNRFIDSIIALIPKYDLKKIDNNYYKKDSERESVHGYFLLPKNC